MYIEMWLRKLSAFFRFTLAVLLIQFCQSVTAGTIESLVMPGKVIEGHKKYEQTCKKCHSIFSKGAQDKLCADCHKNIGKDIRRKTGYHGRQKQLGKCKNCHTEHKGREADIVKFNTNLFDHDQTDFRLKGQHAGLVCDKCHKKNKKYHEASSKCSSCHKRDSPHDVKKLVFRKKLIDCAACHSAKGWDFIVFDHDKTKFKLSGKHEPVKCVNCHPNNRYQKTPKNCYSCHKYDDVHKRKKGKKGKKGKKCEKCHNPIGWKELKFNHNKETKFPLKGKHKKLQCGDCHKKDPYKVKVKKTCISCHKLDDIHHDRFGKKCGKCHKSSGWKKVKFNHDKDTKFRLRAKHKDASCEDCHSRNAYKDETKKDCYSCHKKDDVHERQQSERCSKCHTEYGWRKKVVFDHDITKFPLLGLHAGLSCEECHLNAAYKDAERECHYCHKKDDVHKGRLGLACQVCHNSNDWRVWRFNHNKQTKFKLDGKHKDLHCHDCHRKSVRTMKNQLSECNDCHAANDVHDGQFGRNCARCHSTKTFKNAKLK